MEIPVQTISLNAGADLQLKRYYAVKVNTDGDIVLAGAGENAIGILQNTPNHDQSGAVMTLGVAFFVSGGVIAAGANLTPDASGKLVTAGGGDAVIGVALKAAANNDIGTVLLVTRTATGTTGIAASYSQIQIPVTLSALDNMQILSDWTPGFAGTIEKIEFICTTATTDAAVINCVLNATIGGVATTGGVLTISVAAAGTDPDTIGKVIAGTAITGANSFIAGSLIDIAVGNTANPFTDGAGIVIMTLKH